MHHGTPPTTGVWLPGWPLRTLTCALLPPGRAQRYSYAPRPSSCLFAGSEHAKHSAHALRWGRECQNEEGRVGSGLFCEDGRRIIRGDLQPHTMDAKIEIDDGPAVLLSTYYSVGTEWSAVQAASLYSHGQPPRL